MRRDVLAHLRPHPPTFGDHAYAVLSVLAAPAPFIVRAALAVVVAAALVASATVASADALPDEPLYGVKVASEQLRLAAAQTPEDRAVVWLSMAEHRLTEAERLALAGREPEALVAASAYGTQLAEAAAELASIERLQANGPSVVARLKQRLVEQQARATDIAAKLRTGTANARSAPAFDTVASAPPAEPSGTLSELIAEHAAAVTDQVAAVAERRAVDEEVALPPAAAAEGPPAPVPPAAAAEQRRPPPPARPAQAPAREAPAGPGAEPQGIGNVAVPADPTPTASATPENEDRPRDQLGQELSEIQRRFKDALEQIRQKQKEAREAVKRAQERGKQTPDPARANGRGADEDPGDDDRGEDGED